MKVMCIKLPTSTGINAVLSEHVLVVGNIYTVIKVEIDEDGAFYHLKEHQVPPYEYMYNVNLFAPLTGIDEMELVNEDYLTKLVEA